MWVLHFYVSLYPRTTTRAHHITSTTNIQDDFVDINSDIEYEERITTTHFFLPSLTKQNNKLMMNE